MPSKVYLGANSLPYPFLFLHPPDSLFSCFVGISTSRATMPKQIAAFFLVVIVAQVAVTSTSTNFKWEASINRDTGIASSCEVSIFPISTRIADNKVANMADKIIAGYPKFLTRPSLTLGLLKVKHVSVDHTDLRTRICPWCLLTFGRPIDTQTLICKKLAREYSGVVICSSEIPIVNGLLAQSKGDGCLRFTLIRKAKCENSHLVNTLLITEIDGQYKPSIAGSRCPRSKVRCAIYCATQRMFHEYVMWRFHRLLRAELENICM